MLSTILLARQVGSPLTALSPAIGRLYDNRVEHIKSLKALHDATLHANPAHRNAAHLKGQSDEDAEPPFYCPVANLPLNGRYPFVLIKSTGNVVSQRALKQVGGKVCPITEQPISPADALSINPLEEERKEML